MADKAMADKWHFFPRDETPGHREPAMVITPNGKVTGLPENDLRLIAAAGTAASEVADMGYDPVEALRRWPKLLEAASALLADIDTCGHPVDPAYRDWLANELDRAAGKEGDDGR